MPASILLNLSGIDDVWIAVSQEDYAAADRLGRAFSDDLRLIPEERTRPAGAAEPGGTLLAFFNAAAENLTNLPLESLQSCP